MFILDCIIVLHYLPVGVKSKLMQRFMEMEQGIAWTGTLIKSLLSLKCSSNCALQLWHCAL